MKILIVLTDNINSNTSAMIGNLNLINGFLKKGFEVDVFSPISDQSMDIPIKNNSLNIINYNIGNDIINKISLSKSNIISLLKKIYKKFISRDKTYKFIKNIDYSVFNEKEYKVIISISDPKSSHILANKIIDNTSIDYEKYVQIWGDPIFNDITNRTIFKKRLIKEEIKHFGKADNIIYVSPSTLLAQKNLFKLYKDKMSFLPLPAGVEENKKYNIKHDIGYYGAYYSTYRNIIPFHDAIKEFNYLKSFIMGNSDIVLDQTKNVITSKRGDSKPHEDASKILVAILNTHGTQIPAKINYYSSYNKPIMVILDGDNNLPFIESYLIETNRFYLTKNNKKDIIETINKIINEYDIDYKYNKSNYYSQDRIVNEFLKIIKKDD